MMKGIKYACFSFFSFSLLSACSMNQSSESSMDNTTMNTTTSKNFGRKDASVFELKDMWRGMVKLSDYKGMKFWAILGPCHKVCWIRSYHDTIRDFEILTIMAPDCCEKQKKNCQMVWSTRLQVSTGLGTIQIGSAFVGLSGSLYSYRSFYRQSWEKLTCPIRGPFQTKMLRRYQVSYTKKMKPASFF